MKEVIPIIMGEFYSGILDGLTPILGWEKLVEQSEWGKALLIPSHCDNAPAYGKPDKVGFVADIQLFHQVGFVRLHRS